MLDVAFNRARFKLTKIVFENSYVRPFTGPRL